jgi:hypothetical protein
MAPVYCEAVLRYDERVALDGSPAETIDAEAKDLATKQLARLAARETAKKANNAAAPAVVKRNPATVPPTKTPSETPDLLRGRVRASLLRRRALRSRDGGGSVSGSKGDRQTLLPGRAPRALMRLPDEEKPKRWVELWVGPFRFRQWGA